MSRHEKIQNLHSDFDINDLRPKDAKNKNNNQYIIIEQLLLSQVKILH